MTKHLSFSTDSVVAKRQRLQSKKTEFLEIHLRLLKILEEDCCNDDQLWNMIEEFMQRRNALTQKKLEALRWRDISLEFKTEFDPKDFSNTGSRSRSAANNYFPFYHEVTSNETGLLLLAKVIGQRQNVVHRSIEQELQSFTSLLNRTLVRIKDLQSERKDLKKTLSLSCSNILMEQTTRKNLYERKTATISTSKSEIPSFQNFRSKFQDVDDDINRSRLVEFDTKINLWTKLRLDLQYVLH